MNFARNPVFTAQYCCSVFAEVEAHSEKTLLLCEGANAPFVLYERRGASYNAHVALSCWFNSCESCIWCSSLWSCFDMCLSIMNEAQKGQHAGRGKTTGQVPSVCCPFRASFIAAMHQLSLQSVLCLSTSNIFHHKHAACSCYPVTLTKTCLFRAKEERQLFSEHSVPYITFISLFVLVNTYKNWVSLHNTVLPLWTLFVRRIFWMLL